MHPRWMLWTVCLLIANAVAQKTPPATVPQDCVGYWQLLQLDYTWGCSAPSPSFYQNLPPEHYQRALKDYRTCLDIGHKSKQMAEANYAACLGRTWGPGDLINILDKAGQKGWKPDQELPAMPLPKGGRHNKQGESFQQGDKALSANCSQYFREIMRQFANLGWPVDQELIDANSNANVIIRNIRNHPDQWQLVVEANVQALADRGAVVAGVAPSDIDSGHIATAFPNSAHADLSKIPGNGPLVRDGNEHPINPTQDNPKPLHPGSWGAIKANWAFDYKNNPPAWYVWMPSLKKD